MSYRDTYEKWLHSPALSAAENPVAVILNEGDRVTIHYEVNEFESADDSIVFSTTVRLDASGTPAVQQPQQPAGEAGTGAETQEQPAAPTEDQTSPEA